MDTIFTDFHWLLVLIIYNETLFIQLPMDERWDQVTMWAVKYKRRHASCLWYEYHHNEGIVQEGEEFREVPRWGIKYLILDVAYWNNVKYATILIEVVLESCLIHNFLLLPFGSPDLVMACPWWSIYLLANELYKAHACPPTTLTLADEFLNIFKIFYKSNLMSEVIQLKVNWHLIQHFLLQM